MMDSRKWPIYTSAAAVLLAASLPALYPLAVAFAACCDRRLPRSDSRLIGFLIIVAILSGTALVQLGWVPLLLPAGAGVGLRGGLGWAWGAITALSVWIVVARIGCWRQCEAAPATEAEVRRESGTRSSAGGSVQLELDSRNGPVEWDQPTQVVFPAERSSVSHLTYDFDASTVVDAWINRTTIEAFRDSVLASGLSSLDETMLVAAPGEQTAQLVQRLIAMQRLTRYQAVLLCAGLPNLLRIAEFEVVDRLGRGGMAMVLRVRHRITGHQYALKLLEELNPIDPVIRKRFLREMEAVCALAHPSIAVARSVGHQGNRMHIAMELVEGKNLAEWVAQKGPLLPQQALDYVGQAARALAHAHERGLVHRDVKPANLMLGPDDQVKLVDMGLARFVDAIELQGAGQSAWHTNTGHLIGTIDYMAPEQAEELAASDHRSDIYSLGCTLFFLLTGQSHLRGRTQRRRALSLVNRSGLTELRSLRDDLPECLYYLVGKMTRLDPEARYQTMAEVIEAMDQCALELGLQAPSERHYRLLMVEDSMTQSIMTRETLLAASPHVAIETVTLLGDAVAACSRDQFDVVLLDLNLPDSKGVCTVSTLREAEPRTPIIVLTSSSDPELGVQCVAAGADDFLPKQEIEPRMLQRHILLAIGRHKANARSAASSSRVPVEAVPVF